jgi:hypothetical protein
MEGNRLSSFFRFFFSFCLRRNSLNGLVHTVIPSFDKIISKLDTTI